MRVQVTICLLLLMLDRKVTCTGGATTTDAEKSSRNCTTSDPGLCNHANLTTSTELSGLTNTTNAGTGTVTEGLKNATNAEKGTLMEDILNTRTILTFLAGAASTAVIVSIALCFVGMCIRCGTVKAVDGNAKRAEVKLETVKIQHDPDATEKMEEDENTPLRGFPAAVATNSGAVNNENKVEVTPGEGRPSGQEEAAEEQEQKDVDYACIDYSLLQGREAEAQKAQGQETEYAEIQIKKQDEENKPEDLQDGEGEDKAQESKEQEQMEGEDNEIQV